MNKTLKCVVAFVLVTAMLLGVLPAMRAQPPNTVPAPCMYFVGPSGTSNQTFYTGTMGIGSTFNVTAWINTTYAEAGWTGALLFNATQLHALSVAFTANGSSQSAWLYDQGIYAPVGAPPFLDYVTAPSAPDNVLGTIGEPAGFGEVVMGTTVVNASVDSLFTVTFEVVMVPTPSDTSLTSQVRWDTAVSMIATPISTADPNATFGNFTYSLVWGSPRVQSNVQVACSPCSASVGSPVTCTASVNGSSPTGTVSWMASSGTGYFSPAVCTLSSGNCSTSYTDNNTGFETITASYSGDSNNLPSGGSDALTLFANVTTGTNVAVTPTNDLELDFANVTTAGNTVANATATVNAPTLNNTIGQYYSINVTASFSGNVTVSVAFDGSNMTTQQKANLTMIQYTPIPGDVVAPFGIVNMNDVAYIARHYGTTPASPNWDPVCDLNGDGIVNMKDIAIVARHYGLTANWVNITTYVDTTNNIIYGTTTHFSFIGIHR